uniref:Transmembrane protease, serine 11a n=1 Tax=Jaculus jaculus TaxID=51337 RepID=A0A8C5LCX7_JACJA
PKAVEFVVRKRALKTGVVAFLTLLSLITVSATIGLLAHFLIWDIQVNSNSGRRHSHQLKDLQEMSENVVDEIFVDSALNKHYIKNNVVRRTAEGDVAEADVMAFQFPATEPRAERESKTHAVLNQKIRNKRAFPINVSAVQANGCGKRAVPLIVNRIVSGSLAVRGAWPWQASLQRSNIHQCGGTLIGNMWLVTAAHCFKSNANPRQWKVSFGTTISPPLMERDVKRIVLHARYRPPARAHDIAVVQFAPRVAFSDDVRRICLPAAAAPFPWNSTVYITGFGALYYGGESQNNLREARVQIISNDICKQPQVYGNDIQPGMFCAGYLEGIYDACRGDSGGPLVVKDNKDTWYLIGIVSWGYNCGQKNKPGVYTDVTYYRRWIASKTGL